MYKIKDLNENMLEKILEENLNGFRIKKSPVSLKTYVEVINLSNNLSYIKINKTLCIGKSTKFKVKRQSKHLIFYM